jgi:hypothetical protein
MYGVERRVGCLVFVTAQARAKCANTGEDWDLEIIDEIAIAVAHLFICPPRALTSMKKTGRRAISTMKNATKSTLSAALGRLYCGRT